MELESCHMETTRGDWLKRQMARRDISVRQIADALDVTTQTVYGWQNSKTVISEDRVPRLAEMLGISEIEARRGLGYWVPDEGMVEQSSEDEDEDEIDRQLDIMRAAIAKVERLKRGRSAS